MSPSRGHCRSDSGTEGTSTAALTTDTPWRGRHNRERQGRTVCRIRRSDRSDRTLALESRLQTRIVFRGWWQPRSAAAVSVYPPPACDRADGRYIWSPLGLDHEPALRFPRSRAADRLQEKG